MSKCQTHNRSPCIVYQPPTPNGSDSRADCGFDSSDLANRSNFKSTASALLMYSASLPPGVIIRANSESADSTFLICIITPHENAYLNELDGKLRCVRSSCLNSTNFSSPAALTLLFASPSIVCEKSIAHTGC